MRKIYYLLCMICTLGAFSACSDDDDEVESLLPVTEIVVPARVQAGGELILAGNGFAQDCKILLKNGAQSVELAVSERLSASVGCIIPVTLTPGEYTVVLVQSGEWPLRKITVLEQGAGNPDAPVVALVFPAGTVNAGEEAYIQGIGFAKNCEIDVKVGEELLKMEIKVSNNGVKFNVPEAWTDGVYPVVLKQDGGEWVLGEIIVKAKAVVQKTQINQIIDRWSKKNKDHVRESNYTYDSEGRISSIEMIEDGEPDSRITFEWAAGSLKVSESRYNPINGIYDDPDTYTYQLNAEENAESVNIESVWDGPSEETWEYTPEGYLKVVQLATGEYKYEGANHITNLHYIDDYDEINYNLEYESNQANLSVVDLTGEILYYCRVIPQAQYYARIAGICGKLPDLLPSLVTAVYVGWEDEAEIRMITYETDPGDGYISKILYDDDHTFEITYK